MKKTLFGAIMLLCFCVVNPVSAQKNRKRSIESSPKVVEINKMVSLDENQKKQLGNLYVQYANMLDSALFKVENAQESSELIYKTKKYFDKGFMNILSDNQKKEYVRNISTPEIRRKTEGRIHYLRTTSDYSESELEQFSNEIFEYFMLEKYVYTTEKYNIIKQKENIAQLKKLEPQSLKTANGLQKAKHQGKKYQDGFQW